MHGENAYAEIQAIYLFSWNSGEKKLKKQHHK